MTDAQLPLLIAGAGPGGLTAALTALRCGMPFVVLEKVTRQRLFSDVGGGYDIGANTLAMLDHLGVGQGVRATGTKMQRVVSMRTDGTPFDVMPLPADLDLTSSRRSDLQRVLLEALPAERLLSGDGVAEVRQGPRSVEVELASGTRVEGSVLIAADGVHSRTRHAVFDDGPPGFCGLTCVWGRVGIDRLDVSVGEQLPRLSGVSWMGSGAVCLGGRMADEWLWSAFYRTAQFERSPDRETARTRLLDRFEGWSESVTQLIERTDTARITEVGIWDRDPVPSWVSGRCALIGDAAHPMTPFLGQGANAAMTDAFTLVQMLSRRPFEEALAVFEERRKEAVEGTVRSARSLANWMTTESDVGGWVFRTGLRLAPMPLIMHALRASDRPNNVKDLLS
ncbi:MAG: FAD-dependent oxidoreductase [Sandaracinaceae bacterium]